VVNISSECVCVCSLSEQVEEAKEANPVSTKKAIKMVSAEHNANTKTNRPKYAMPKEDRNTLLLHYLLHWSISLEEYMSA